MQAKRRIQSIINEGKFRVLSLLLPLQATSARVKTPDYYLCKSKT